MNLIIDQGNSFFKVGLFNENEIISKSSFSYNDVDLFYNWVKNNTFDSLNVIISSVINSELDLSNIKTNDILILNPNTSLPIKNSYGTPKTLGNDRIANSVAAFYLKPNCNSLIIDLGTCIKYDLINSNNEYIGGNISPGLNMRFKSLNNQTDQLPRLTSTIDIQEHGSDTNSSIICGVQLGIIHEINGFISQYENQFGELTIFMTGGDSKYFEKSIKNHIFANSNLTLIGLNEILKYNG